MPAIVLYSGKTPILTYRLIKAETLVGRGPMNDLMIPDERVSRYQFIIKSDAAGFRVSDRSGRGMTLNERNVKESTLKNGDELVFGGLKARFMEDPLGGLDDMTTGEGIGSGTDLLSEKDEESRLKTEGAAITVRSSPAGSMSIGAGPVNIGKDEGNQLRLTERFVSAFHARIYRDGGKYRIRDLGSTNGTFVNGARVMDTEIPDGAVLRLGSTELVFRLNKAGSAPDGGRFGMIGISGPMMEVYGQIEKAAPSEAHVLVTGETGTGKELAARALHRHSQMSDRAFIPVNCAALARDVMESELFGHERGSFTGALTLRKGAFEEADGGTLFLDEIGEIPIGLQAKLLRAIEYGEVKRIGANRPIKVHPRIIAATNRNPREEIKAGRFREDLYYRLGVIIIRMPSLRERAADIPVLAEAILAEMTGGARRFTAEALAEMRGYVWPGNVRELKNVISRAVIMGSSPVIAPEDLKWMPPDKDDLSGMPPSFLAGKTLEDIEREAILAELERLGGSKERTAKSLGIGLTTLKDKLRQWNLQKTRDGEDSQKG